MRSAQRVERNDELRADPVALHVLHVPWAEVRWAAEANVLDDIPNARLSLPYRQSYFMNLAHILKLPQISPECRTKTSGDPEIEKLDANAAETTKPLDRNQA